MVHLMILIIWQLDPLGVKFPWQWDQNCQRIFSYSIMAPAKAIADNDIKSDYCIQKTTQNKLYATTYFFKELGACSCQMSFQINAIHNLPIQPKADVVDLEAYIVGRRYVHRFRSFRIHDSINYYTVFVIKHNCPTSPPNLMRIQKTWRSRPKWQDFQVGNWP